LGELIQCYFTSYFSNRIYVPVHSNMAHQDASMIFWSNQEHGINWAAADEKIFSQLWLNF